MHSVSTYFILYFFDLLHFIQHEPHVCMWNLPLFTDLKTKNIVVKVREQTYKQHKFAKKKNYGKFKFFSNKLDIFDTATTLKIFYRVKGNKSLNWEWKLMRREKTFGSDIFFLLPINIHSQFKLYIVFQLNEQFVRNIVKTKKKNSFQFAVNKYVTIILSTNNSYKHVFYKNI